MSKYLNLDGLSHFKNKVQDKMQFTTMPTASSTYLNKVVQYIGTTTNTYNNGAFYKCISDGLETPTYSWKIIPFETEVNASVSGDTLILTFGSSS